MGHYDDMERDELYHRHHAQWFDEQVAGKLGELCGHLEHAARNPDGKAAQQLARLRELLKALTD